MILRRHDRRQVDGVRRRPPGAVAGDQVVAVPAHLHGGAVEQDPAVLGHGLLFAAW